MTETSQKPLDLDTLERLTVRLQEAISAYNSEPENLFYLDSVVKRFELTFEISRKLLRRYLIDIDPENAKISPDSFTSLSVSAQSKNCCAAHGRSGNKSGMPATRRCMDITKKKRVRSPTWPNRCWRKRWYCLKILSGGRLAMAAEIRVDISEESLAAIGRVLQQRMPGRPAFLFGSRVTGLARPDSDLDLAIGGEPPLSLRERGVLSDALEEIGIGVKVDIIDLHDARGIFRSRIESEWIPLERAMESPSRANL